MLKLHFIRLLKEKNLPETLQFVASECIAHSRGCFHHSTSLPSLFFCLLSSFPLNFNPLHPTPCLGLFVSVGSPFCTKQGPLIYCMCLHSCPPHVTECHYIAILFPLNGRKKGVLFFPSHPAFSRLNSIESMGEKIWGIVMLEDVLFLPSISCLLYRQIAEVLETVFANNKWQEFHGQHIFSLSSPHFPPY